MLDFPVEADEPSVILLMVVARADGRVLKEETDQVLSFFSDRLAVSPERLTSIRALVARYSVAGPTEAQVLESLERLPSGGQDLLFNAALEVAISDNDLATEEKRELQKVGRAFGLSEEDVRNRLHQALGRREDAFSLLGVGPEAEWEAIELAYRLESEKYDPIKLSALGVAFQNLAIDRLDKVEWAYKTLKSIYQESVRHESPPQAGTRTLIDLNSLDLPPTIKGRLDRYEIDSLETLEALLATPSIKGLQTKTRLIFQHLHNSIHDSIVEGRLDHRLFNEYFPRDLDSLGIAAPAPTETSYHPEELSTEDPAELWRSMPEFLEPLFKERTWDVLKRRLGFSGSPQTLEEIGLDHGVTRERIRQIEKKAKKKMRALSLLGDFKGQRLHPGLVEVCKRIFSAIQSAIPEPILQAGDYNTRLASSLPWLKASDHGLFPVFEDWLGVEHHTIWNERFVFRGHSSKDLKSFEALGKKLKDLLMENMGQLHMGEVLVALEKHWSDLRCTQEAFLNSLPFIKLNPRGVLELDIRDLTRPAQAYRILSDAGEPLHYEEIVRRLNSRLPEEDQVEVRNLANRLVEDKRIIPVGRSGEWALAEWEHVETRPIADILKSLIRSRGPLTVEELTDAVQSVRSCSENSVVAYVSMDDDFVRTGYNQYSLKELTGRDENWGHEEVGRLVEQFFDKSFHTVVPFKNLKKSVMDATELPSRVASGILRHHPSVRTERGSSCIMASFRQDWRAYQKPKRVFKEPTTQEQVDTFLGQALSERSEITLREAVQELEKVTGSPPSSLYSYITNSPVCDKFDRDGQRWVGLPSGLPLVATKDLLERDIPTREDDEEKHTEFALSFDGYRHWGEEEWGARLRDCESEFRQTRRLPEDTEDLRAFLFVLQRAYRHGGHPDEDWPEAFYCGLEELRKRVRESQTTQAGVGE